MIRSVTIVILVLVLAVSTTGGDHDVGFLSPPGVVPCHDYFGIPDLKVIKSATRQCRAHTSGMRMGLSSCLPLQAFLFGPFSSSPS